MAFRTTANFDAPIPGQSLTAELGARPWQTPPEFTTIEEAIEYYIPRLSNANNAVRMLEVIERGIPLTALAEVLTLAGVMEGKHTVDVGILISPVLVEFMEGMAKVAEIEYTLGDVDEGMQADPKLVADAMKELKDSRTKITKEFKEFKEQDEEIQPAVDEKPVGLMARRGE
jgi:hypothetical protein